MKCGLLLKCGFQEVLIYLNKLWNLLNKLREIKLMNLVEQ